MMSRESAEPVDAQEQPDNIATLGYSSTINKGYFRVSASNLTVPGTELDQSYRIRQCSILSVYYPVHTGQP